jgi:hypothetical protein
MPRSFFEYGLSLGVDRTSLAYNQAIQLLGHNALDMAQPTRALQVYTECLESCRKLVDSSDSTIANVLDSVACGQVEPVISVTEVNLARVPRALEGEVRGGSSLEGAGKGRLWRKGSRKGVD